MSFSEKVDKWLDKYGEKIFPLIASLWMGFWIIVGMLIGVSFVSILLWATFVFPFTAFPWYLPTGFWLLVLAVGALAYKFGWWKHFS